MTHLASLIEQNLLGLFNQRNRHKRAATIKKLWATGGVFWSSEGTYIGHREIEDAAAALQRRFPEFDFAPVGDIDEIPRAARLRWSFGAPGRPPAITGLDVITTANGKIAHMYRFLDGASL